MEVLTEEELATRLDFRRPLKDPSEEPRSAWPIPFEYGANTKGTRISIAKAKQIAAELRAEVAEAEKRELFSAFKQEQARCESFSAQLSAAKDRLEDTLGEVASMKQMLRRRKKTTRG